MKGTVTTPEVRVRSGLWPIFKRLIDVAGSAAGLIVLAPFFALLAVAVRLDSPGPVFFRQTRIGRGLEEFTVLKFRTMLVGQSDEIHREYIARLVAGGADEPLKKLTEDPRVTRVGRMLRKTSLDELPQLVNVLRGDMSLVGPRPAIGYELEHYAPRHFERFAVKPGMTGLWQVSGRNRLGFTEMLDLDAQYAATGGPATDLGILLKTPAAALRKDAA